MKLDWCPKHKGAKDKTLTCYRLRHDDGRQVTDEEAMAAISKLREVLAIFVHAHRSGNAVPPHIEAEAKELLTPNAVVTRRAPGDSE